VENFVENSGARRVFLDKPGEAAVCTTLVRIPRRAERLIINRRFQVFAGAVCFLLRRSQKQNLV
jgi:hypothetical protein